MVNEPFASVSNGPQGAIVVQYDEMRTAAATDDVVSSAIRHQHSERHLVHAQENLRTLQRIGLKSPQAALSFPRRLVHLSDGKIVAPNLMRALETRSGLGDPSNEIRFSFEGFSDADETSLRDYLKRAIPVAYNVYGRPAFDIDVTVRLDEEIRRLQGGVYDSSRNEIRMAPLSGNLAEDTFVLLVLVLQAFHDDVGFFYDAWAEGFAGAAATVIQTRSGVAPGYDPTFPGPFYAGSVYEPQNQPELGAPTFYPASGWSGMLAFRVAMARSAWFKCWVEDRDFFRRFNEAYYDNFTEDLPGNIPALRVLASRVLPEVEGMPFQEWYQRQWVLDTSVRIGRKLFVWNVAIDRSVALVAQHFFTTHDGDEEPRGGQARTTYWSYDFAVSLYAEEGNRIDIASDGDDAGSGFLIPTFFNIGGPQSVTVQVDLDSIRKMLPFPYGVHDPDRDDNTIYGSIIHARRGKIDIEGGRSPEDVSVDRSVWSEQVTDGPLTPRQVVVTFTNEEGQEVRRTINVAWRSYSLPIKGGRQRTLTKDLSGDPPGVHMISFPFHPPTQDLAELLGVSSDRLLAARWNPRAPDANKYELWPRMEPIEPGRGYFIRIFEDVSISLEGVMEPEDRTAILPVSVGWNMIGSPRRSPVDVSSLRFEIAGGEPMTYNEAVERRIIQDGVLGYCPKDGYLRREQMVPFEGYWIRALRSDGALIHFPSVNQTSAASIQAGNTASSLDAALDWQFPIVAEAADLRGRAWLAAAADAETGADRYDLQAPPGFGPRVSVELMREGSERGYYRDVRPSSAPEQTWQMRVRSNVPEAEVRLTWSDLSEIPDGIRPVLVDELADRRACMLTNSSYRLPATDEGVERRLRVECVPRASQTMMVSGITARQAGSEAAEVVFNLSAPAEVELTVLNIAGRTINAIPAGERPDGQNTLSWNLRDRAGGLVPSGTYLVQVQANDRDGRRSNALGTLQITR